MVTNASSQQISAEQIAALFPRASKSVLALNQIAARQSPNVVDIFEPKRKPKQPNKTEAAFGQILEARKQKGEVIWYQYEGVTIRWGCGRSYTCDWFSVERVEGLSYNVCWMYETKGAWLYPGAKRRFLEAKDNCQWAQFAMFQRVRGVFTRIL